MIRTMLIDDKARELSLVFHNDSVISNIKNTSAFRNESGFDDNLYYHSSIELICLSHMKAMSIRPA